MYLAEFIQFLLRYNCVVIVLLLWSTRVTLNWDVNHRNNVAIKRGLLDI